MGFETQLKPPNMFLTVIPLGVVNLQLWGRKRIQLQEGSGFPSWLFTSSCEKQLLDFSRI